MTQDLGFPLNNRASGGGIELYSQPNLTVLLVSTSVAAVKYDTREFLRLTRYALWIGILEDSSSGNGVDI